MSLFAISSFVSTLSPLLPLFIYYRSWRVQDLSMLYLAMLLVLSLLADAIGMINSFYLQLRYVNETVSYVYYFLAIITACLFYIEQFPQKFRAAFIFIILALFAVYGYWLLGDISIIALHDSKVPAGILFTIFSVSHFYVLIKEMPVTYIHRLPMFWINSGLLVYASGTLILFGITVFFYYDLRKDQLEYWIFHNFLNTTCNILITIGLSKVNINQHYRTDERPVL